MDAIQVFDHVLPDPAAYRAAALALPYEDVTIGADTFYGIARAQVWPAEGFAHAHVSLSFFRKSPEGQREPTYIHSDAGMGADVTGVLYLNPDPPPGDGTSFWRHQRTDQIRGAFDPVEAKTGLWKRWKHVPAQFGRLVLFPSDYYHSRGLVQNYGTGDDARLTQVVFATTPKRPALTIRDASDADVPAIIAMASRFVGSTPYGLQLSVAPERVAGLARYLIDHPDGTVLVADAGGTAVGFLALLAHDHVWAAERVAVEIAWWMDTAHRGSGGLRLLKAGEAWARAQGATVMQMIAPTEDVARVYTHGGYTRVETAFQKRV